MNGQTVVSCKSCKTKGAHIHSLLDMPKLAVQILVLIVIITAGGRKQTLCQSVYVLLKWAKRVTSTELTELHCSAARLMIQMI